MTITSKRAKSLDISALERIVFDALEDVKAQDIKVFDTVGMTDLFDRVVIASGTSNRQTRALAIHVHEKVKEAGGHIIATEGEGTGEWVLVDAGDIVVHIMQPAIRQYYNLEELWGRKLVSMTKAAVEKKPAAKKAAAKKPATKTAKASTATDETAVETAVEIVTSKKAATKTSTASKSAAKPADKPADKPATKRLVTKNPAAPKPPSKFPSEKKQVTKKLAGRK
jgi:ribosome-associated protein